MAFQWCNGMFIHRKPLGVLKVDKITVVNVKLDVLAKNLERLDMKTASTPSYKMYGRGYASYECKLGNDYAYEPTNEKVNILNYNQRGRPCKL